MIEHRTQRCARIESTQITSILMYLCSSAKRELFITFGVAVRVIFCAINGSNTWVFRVYSHVNMRKSFD